MFFGTVPTPTAAGCILAHSLKIDGKRIAKGRRIDAALIAELIDADCHHVMVARLEATDIHEDEAAAALAAAISGTGIRIGKASTGRVNLFAAHTGLLHFQREHVLDINSIDESITLACLPENSWVPAGRMIATVKIIPYAVDADALAQAVSSADKPTQVEDGSAGIERLFSVHAPQALTVDLIQTSIGAGKPALLQKTRDVLEQRLHARGLRLRNETRCDHHTDDVCQHLQLCGEQQAHMIIVAGASAISDRQDVIPAALTAAGGRIQRFGLPADPGNLLMLGRLEHCTVIGMPGCARSPKTNGFDLILDRIVCGLPISSDWLQSLAVGGLMTEIPERPSPRVASSRKPPQTETQTLPATPTRPAPRAASDTDKTAAAPTLPIAIVLAAGRSQRAGAQNKLTFPLGDSSVLSEVLHTLTQSPVAAISVVTGHEREQIERGVETIAAGRERRSHPPLNCIHNPHYRSGMASSLVAGVSANSEAAAVLICLADMPTLEVATVTALVTAWQQHPEQLAFVPVWEQGRGNPVLIDQQLFDTLLTLSGDEGARRLLREHPDVVMEVPAPSASVLRDLDTLPELQAFASTWTSR